MVAVDADYSLEVVAYSFHHTVLGLAARRIALGPAAGVVVVVVRSHLDYQSSSGMERHQEEDRMILPAEEVDWSNRHGCIVQSLDRKSSVVGIGCHIAGVCWQCDAILRVSLGLPAQGDMMLTVT